MNRYDRDKTLLLKHSPEQLSAAQALNQVGAVGWITLEECPVSYDDDNALFVDKTGNDSTGDGTTANPYLTIQKAVTETDEDHGYVIVQDSLYYIEGALTVTAYLLGLFAATGETPHISLREYDNSYSPTDSNTIYISATDGNDTTGTGTESAPVATITKALTLCDATHQNMLIVDSETYEESGFTLSGNALNLRAAIGESPVVNCQLNTDFWSLSVTESESVFQDDGVYHVDSAIDASGNIIIAFCDYNAGYKGMYVILNSSYDILKTATVYHDGQTSYPAVSILNSGDIFIVYNDDDDSGTTKYVVIDADDYSEVKSETALSVDAGKKSSCVLNSGDIIISYREGTTHDGCFIVLDTSSWVVVKSETTFSSDEIAQSSVILIDDTHVLIGYDNGTDSTGCYQIWDTGAWTVSTSEVVFDSGTGYAEWVQACLLSNGYVFFSYRDTGDSNKAKYQIWDVETDTAVISETTYIDADTEKMSLVLMPNGDICSVFRDVDDSEKGKFIVLENKVYHLKASDDAIIAGLKITTDYHEYLNQLIKTDSAELEIHNCDIYDGTSSTDTCDCTAIEADDNIEIYNSIIRDCDKGLDAGTNNAIIKHSQFYRITAGAAIDIDGSAAASEDILIEHVDLFNNHTGIVLQNNSGDEVIINCILHENANGHSCDTEAAIQYCVCTDSVLDFDTSLHVTTANPMYVNEGAISDDDIDLNLKTRVMGYAVNSPGLAAADDSCNQGAYDVSYALISESWTSITVPKGSVAPEWVPVGLASCTRRDGSSSATKNAIKEMITLSWDTLLLSEFNKILELMDSDSSRVLLYADPDSAPLDYDEYTYVFGNLTGKSPVYVQSETGVESNYILLERAYEGE